MDKEMQVFSGEQRYLHKYKNRGRKHQRNAHRSGRQFCARQTFSTIVSWQSEKLMAIIIKQGQFDSCGGIGDASNKLCGS
jgi:hypothetical protein